MKPKLLLCLFGFFYFVNLNAQEKMSIRANAGIASRANVMDGYYFSVDFGIPLIKSLELVPTFSFASMLPNTHLSNYWNQDSQQPSYGVPYGGPRQEFEHGDIMGSISLMLFFKPFDLVNNEQLDQHELMIGAGYGYKTYTILHAEYDILGTDYQLTNFGYKSSNGWEPYFAKLSYSYTFKKDLSIGLVVGLDGYDGEGVLLTGLQFGVKF